MSEVCYYVTCLLGKYKNLLNVYLVFSMKTKWLLVIKSNKLPMKQKVFITNWIELIVKQRWGNMILILNISNFTIAGMGAFSITRP